MAFYHSEALADIVIILGILGIFYAITQVGHEWTGVLRPTVLIDLSFRALPRYTFFSLVRGLAACCISFLFTIVYGYWAAKATSLFWLTNSPRNSVTSSTSSRLPRCWISSIRQSNAPC
jgi:hypothetical protein